MWVFVILAMIVAGYQAIQHYNAASRYEHVPFFPVHVETSSTCYHRRSDCVRLPGCYGL